MKLSVITTGPYDTNCWLIVDEKTGAAFIVDPAFYSSELENFISYNNVKKLEYIFITHGHADHLCGASYLKEKYGAKIVIGEKDAYLLEEYHFGIKAPEFENSFRPCRADITVKDGDELDFCGETVKIIHTPGHTEGEVCYIINDMFFSGDVLFKGSIGRTDLPGGDIFRLARSLKRISEFSENYFVLPGHGEKTTLEYEKLINSYLKVMLGKR